jgi:hypothetical protein
MGWGVFAARSFEIGEIVDMAPGIVPMPAGSIAVQDSVLDDYAYGYWRLKGYNDVERLYAIMFGMDMFYNHHVEPNLEYMTFGREPAPNVPNASNSVGFIAKRRIEVGEQLFSTYGQEDQGKDWFSRRGIELQNPGESRIESEDMPKYQAEYCSKIYAGIGVPTWEGRILPILPPRGLPFRTDLSSRLAPFDAGFGDAKAKVSISSGERIEITTGLVVSRQLMKGSALGALILPWDDLTEESQNALRTLREHSQLILQYQDIGAWNRIDSFESFEDLAILPVAGNIGLVRRVGDKKPSNCRLTIHSRGVEGSKVGVTLELIATRDIPAGEVLTLNLPPVGSKTELQLLEKEMILTGRSYYAGLFSDDAKDEL